MLRGRVIVTVTGLVLGLGTVAAVPAAASTPRTPAVTADPGSYTAVSPTRVLDTRKRIGVPTTTPVAERTPITVDVSTSVPSGASAVVVNLTVTDAKANGYVTAYAGSTRPGVSNVNFVAGRTVPNLAVVPLDSDRTFTLYNGSAGTVDLIADLSGYYTGGTPAATQQGAFGSLPPVRVLDTRGPIGVSTKAAVPAHGSVTFTVNQPGSGVPADVSAVLLNVTATGGTSNGYVRADAYKATAPATSTLNFAAKQTVAALSVVRTGVDGKITLTNGSGGTVNLVADVQGYFTPGDPVTTGATGALPPARVLNGVTVAARKTYTLSLAGKGGVPKSGVAAAALTVTVGGATANGYVTAYTGSARPDVSNVNFAAGHAVANLVDVDDSGGKVTFYNGSAGTLKLYVDALAYVNAPNLSVPPTTTSRYVSDLDALSATGNSSEGCQDGAQGPALVLLDVGAQTITSPLSASKPGVALVFSDPVDRETYVDLDVAIDSYLDEFVRCDTSGPPNPTIAVGTNNEGAFSGANTYPAYQRGIDWADDVVDPLRAHGGVTVVGAIDLEAGFASTEAQAENWETHYLGATPAGLVVNGSADNCPATFGSTADCGPVKDDNGVSKTWTRAQYVRLTYGLGPGRIRVLPQIYLGIPDQAAQWANIDATSGGRLTFAGSLTERGTCNCGQTAPAAWAALFHAKATQVTSPSIPVATDLQPH